jgi:hypothetical protein
MRNVILRIAALGAALAILPSAGYAQIFFDPASPPPPGSNYALCVGGSNAQVATSPGSDCGGFTANGGTDKIVLGGNNTITLQGAPGGGDIIVGNGTSVTTLDGKNGDVSIGGKLSMNNLTGSVDMGGLVVQNVGAPVNGTDAANKAYVDAAVISGRSILTPFGDTATMTLNVGNTHPGFKATANGEVAALSGTGLTMGNNTGTTVSIDSGTGNANFAGTLTVGGTTTLNGDVKVNGNIDMGGNRVTNIGAPVAATDAANKAYVDTVSSSTNQRIDTANQRIDKANQGIAIAMSVQNPVLTGGDRFGVAVNFGDFAGNNAVGAAAVGILDKNFFGGGEKFGLTGGFGVSNNQAAGRVGMQLTW